MCKTELQYQYWQGFNCWRISLCLFLYYHWEEPKLETDRKTQIPLNKAPKLKTLDTSYSSDLAMSWGTKARSSAMALTISGRESQLSSGPRLLHVETISTTCKTSLMKTLLLCLHLLCGVRVCVCVTSARHSSCSPCRARAAGVAMSGLVHWFRVSVMAANMSPPCW